MVRKECGFKRGGAERYCANLCRELLELGHEVTLLARECEPDIHPGLRVVRVPVGNLTSSIRNRSFHHNSQNLLGHLDVDLVYALSRTYPADAFRVSDPLHANWLDIRYPGRFENWLEHLNPRHRTILSLEKAICSPSNTGVIITNSCLTKKQLLGLYDFPADRIHVVYNGVDLVRFCPAASPKPRNRPVRLLFVAQDFGRKGLDYILESLALLRPAGIVFRLDVVGRDDPKPYQRQASKLGLLDTVRFLGPTGRVEDQYRDADLLVFPTLSDPFANVCLEALACGLPVLTTNTNGAAEILQEAETGFVVDAGNGLASRIATVLHRFSRMPLNYRSAMFHACRTTAEKYTIRRNAERTVQILCGHQKGPGDRLGWMGDDHFGV